jgi:hypothetical protein
LFRRHAFTFLLSVNAKKRIEMAQRLLARRRMEIPTGQGTAMKLQRARHWLESNSGATFRRPARPAEVADGFQALDAGDALGGFLACFAAFAGSLRWHAYGLLRLLADY